METRTKIALVTGGSRGLGKNSALKIAQKGLDVIITYKSSKEEADHVVEEIQALGRKAIAYQLDTKDIKSFDAFIKQVGDHLEENTGSRNIDYLVNSLLRSSCLSLITEEEL